MADQKSSFGAAEGFSDFGLPSAMGRNGAWGNSGADAGGGLRSSLFGSNSNIDYQEIFGEMDKAVTTSTPADDTAGGLALPKISLPSETQAQVSSYNPEFPVQATANPLHQTQSSAGFGGPHHLQGLQGFPTDLTFSPPAPTLPLPPAGNHTHAQQQPSTQPLYPANTARSNLGYALPVHTPALPSYPASSLVPRWTDGELHYIPCISHKRERKRSVTNDPARFYEALPRVPPSWGLNPRTKKNNLFRYTEKGELELGKKYDTKQLLQFIRTPERPDGRLIMWVQTPPAQFTHRYPAATISSHCRWEGCPMKTNTILKGHWRVAFDENADETGERFDPFHNAGYVHLYCLEQITDLIELFMDPTVDIRPDLRRMAKEERNPMSLIRHHQELVAVLDQWILDQTKMHREWDGEGTRKLKGDDFLCRRLTRAYLELETSGRSKFREVRGGIHMGRYMGDLSQYAMLRGRRAESKRDVKEEDSDGDQQPSGPPAKAKSRGRPKARVLQNYGKDPEEEEADPDESSVRVRRTSSVIETTAADWNYPPKTPRRQGEATRKRGREEEEGDEGLVLLPNSPKRRRLSVAAKGREGPQVETAGGLGDLQRLVSRAGPVTRKQSQALNIYLGKLASGESRDTGRMVQMIQKLPFWKRREVQKIVMKQEDIGRRFGSI